MQQEDKRCESCVATQAAFGHLSFRLHAGGAVDGQVQCFDVELVRPNVGVSRSLCHPFSPAVVEIACALHVLEAGYSDTKDLFFSRNSYRGDEYMETQDPIAVDLTSLLGRANTADRFQKKPNR